MLTYQQWKETAYILAILFAPMVILGDYALMTHFHMRTLGTLIAIAVPSLMVAIAFLNAYLYVCKVCRTQITAAQKALPLPESCPHCGHEPS